MGLFDSIAKIFGADKKTGELLKNLVSKLSDLKDKGNLDDIASDALGAFKPVLEKFTNGKLDLSALLPDAKTFIEKLKNVKLPDEVSGIVEKLTKLIK